MTQFDFQAPAELYLGSDWHAAAAQGPKAFRTAAQAIRFALEEAAPVSLKGASLQVANKRHSNDAMIWLYRSPDYPLPRKRPHKPSPARLRAHAAQELT
ncbi:MAG: hypothetical protein KKF33_10970 [Alphaproteobacteria bacterium]|jgi:hypothetical protein|nr:hypothetical protein [Alphaproteobacteria bacterium]